MAFSAHGPAIGARTGRNQTTLVVRRLRSPTMNAFRMTILHGENQLVSTSE
jgi:hypothetical protein